MVMVTMRVMWVKVRVRLMVMWVMMMVRVMERQKLLLSEGCLLTSHCLINILSVIISSDRPAPLLTFYSIIFAISVLLLKRCLTYHEISKPNNIWTARPSISPPLHILICGYSGLRLHSCTSLSEMNECVT